MKNTIKCFLLIVALTIAEANAQNYTVGTPVNDTLTESQYFSFDNCYPNYDFTLTFPYSTVTGIEHILIFTSVTPANSIYTVPGGIINVGDTLHFNQAQNTYTFYFPSNGTIYYIFKAIGTPQIANETYHCGSWVWIDGTSTCFNFRTFMYDNVTCNVLDVSSVATNNDFESEFKIYPNPVKDVLNIKNINSVTEIEIIDLLGKIKFSSIEIGQDISIDISNLLSGLYIIELRSDKKLIRKKIIIE